MATTLSPKVAAMVALAKENHAKRIAAQVAAQQASAAKANMATDLASIARGDKPMSAGGLLDVAKVVGHLSAASLSPASGGLRFNAAQSAAIELALQGKSFCLIGAAGTGKTTVTQEIIQRLQRSSHVLPFSASTKHLIKDAPGIVIVGFTNKAVNNIRKKLPENLKRHCMTIHKLVEYAPEYFEVMNAETGMYSTTMRFVPGMHRDNPLPHVSVEIIEEASMVGTDLYGENMAALPNQRQTQVIFLGDLNQLPPVFGHSILGFKLGELPTIELTEVYRQALLSPIISLATAIRTNASFSLPTNLTEKRIDDRGEHGKLTLHPWKKRVEWESAIEGMRKMIPTLVSTGTLNPEQDIILCPYNKSFGTLELNRIMADYLGKQRNAVVFEVIARFVKSYWAVGDRVMVDRHEAVITKIVRNISYAGTLPVTESNTLDRWGTDSEMDAPSALTPDEILNALDAVGNDDDAKNAASHVVSVYIDDLDEERTLSTAGEINNMLFGYALTVHKSQGSEWEKVFIFLHNSHASLLSRELLYTAVTRAKHELYIICEGDSKTHSNSIKRAAGRPVIPGTTLAEKIEFFRGKKASYVESN